MAEDKTRIIERAQKLLRLAGPKSGTTEHERVNAALEAAKLVEEHDLVLSVPEPKKKRQRPPQPQSAPARSVYQHPNSRPVNDYAPRPQARPFVPVPDPQYTQRSYGSDWRETHVGSTILCSACHLPIMGGAQAWVDVRTGQHRHHNITCDADIEFDFDDTDF